MAMMMRRRARGRRGESLKLAAPSQAPPKSPRWQFDCAGAHERRNRSLIVYTVHHHDMSRIDGLRRRSLGDTRASTESMMSQSTPRASTESMMSDSSGRKSPPWRRKSMDASSILSMRREERVSEESEAEAGPSAQDVKKAHDTFIASLTEGIGELQESSSAGDLTEALNKFVRVVKGLADEFGRNAKDGQRNALKAQKGTFDNKLEQVRRASEMKLKNEKHAIEHAFETKLTEKVVELTTSAGADGDLTKKLLDEAKVREEGMRAALDTMTTKARKGEEVKEKLEGQLKESNARHGKEVEKMQTALDGSLSSAKAAREAMEQERSSLEGRIEGLMEEVERVKQEAMEEAARAAKALEAAELAGRDAAAKAAADAAHALPPPEDNSQALKEADGKFKRVSKEVEVMCRSLKQAEGDLDECVKRGKEAAGGGAEAEAKHKAELARLNDELSAAIMASEKVKEELRVSEAARQKVEDEKEDAWVKISEAEAGMQSAIREKENAMNDAAKEKEAMLERFTTEKAAAVSEATSRSVAAFERALARHSQEMATANNTITQLKTRVNDLRGAVQRAAKYAKRPEQRRWDCAGCARGSERRTA